jgi:hypothetical protein
MVPTRPTPSFHPLPQPGDLYARVHADGRFGVVWVTKLQGETSCVVTTEYLDATMPTLDDPRTRRPQRYVWWKDQPDTPCVVWYKGPPPTETFVYLGRRLPDDEELRLGGDDAGAAFGGLWKSGVGYQTVRAWTWTKDTPR